MKKVALKNKIENMDNDTQKILEKIFMDSIIEINTKDFICKDILERIVLVYLYLFENKNYIEIDDLTKYEKNLLIKIIANGIVKIIINDEYLISTIKVKKMYIINEIAEVISIIKNVENINTINYIKKEVAHYIQFNYFRELV